jgi:hypothetical protein
VVGSSCSERSDPHDIDCEEHCLVGFDAVRFCFLMEAVRGVAPRKAECLRNFKRQDIKYTCKSYCIKLMPVFLLVGILVYLLMLQWEILVDDSWIVCEAKFINSFVIKLLGNVQLSFPFVSLK